MKKLMIFPYNNDVEAALQWVDIVEKYQLVYIGLKKEQDSLHNVEITNCELGIDVKKGCEMADIILLVDDPQCRDYTVYQEIAMAAKGKEVILDKSLYTKIGKGYFKGCITNFNFENEFIDYFHKNFLYEINAPVITIMGMGENCDKLSSIFSVTSLLKKKGFKVLGICSNALGILFDLKVIPGCMYNKELTFTEKIIWWNHVVYRLTEEEKPDIVVMEIPGGILPINKFENNFFGELASVMNYAIVPDICIVNLYYPVSLTDEQAEKISLFCDYKFNAKVNAYFISKQQYRTDSEQEKIIYLNLSEKEYIENFPADLENYKTVNILARGELEEMVDECITILSDNIDAI
ncbi:TIGR04066 family peptide maturation system protein [Blautia schinkii]|nr:TIGR04066 family peptide maturation system protein [Blautia schinkii]